MASTRFALTNMHTREACEGGVCCIHNPSNHHMRDWRQVWRSDRGLMERTCPHGIGHPDPDHMVYVLAMRGPVGERDAGVHGCDGCCRGSSTPNNDHAVDQAAL